MKTMFYFLAAIYLCITAYDALIRIYKHHSALAYKAKMKEWANQINQRLRERRANHDLSNA